jgi:hypothetical protein
MPKYAGMLELEHYVSGKTQACCADYDRRV